MTAGSRLLPRHMAIHRQEVDRYGTRASVPERIPRWRRSDRPRPVLKRMRAQRCRS